MCFDKLLIFEAAPNIRPLTAATPKPVKKKKTWTDNVHRSRAQVRAHLARWARSGSALHVQRRRRLLSNAESQNLRAMSSALTHTHTPAPTSSRGQSQREKHVDAQLAYTLPQRHYCPLRQPCRCRQRRLTAHYRGRHHRRHRRHRRLKVRSV